MRFYSGRKKVLSCDRCGKRVNFRQTSANGGYIRWDEDVCGQTLCPECVKEFDAWFDQFMRGGQKDETQQD